ncbi:MAG: hypothetical protein EPO23_03800 [Xanthobacteraceae bacterium]|nr:MAG: hypothetical protein EPO23_03800 [Xanthobacteraceae bacterium]
MASVSRIDVRRELDRLASMPVRSAAQARMRREAAAMIAAEHLVEAAASFRFVDLDSCEDGQLRAGGKILYAPRLIPEEGRLTALACGTATIGDALERRVSALFAERRPALALALDDLGNQLLFEVSRRLQDRMLGHALKRNLTMAGELRAGDPGLDLSYQPVVVQLADGAAIGVGVSAGLALTPLKSMATVMGAGVDLPPAAWSRCDECPSSQKCKLARPQAATALQQPGAP